MADGDGESVTTLEPTGKCRIRSCQLPACGAEAGTAHRGLGLVLGQRVEHELMSNALGGVAWTC